MQNTSSLYEIDLRRNTDCAILARSKINARSYELRAADWGSVLVFYALYRLQYSMPRVDCQLTIRLLLPHRPILSGRFFLLVTGDSLFRQLLVNCLLDCQDSGSITFFQCLAECVSTQIIEEKGGGCI